MLLNLLLDLILVIILVFGSYFGYTRGLFRLLVMPARLLLCLLFSLALSRRVGEAVVLPLIEGPVTNILRDLLYEKCLGLDPGQGIEEIPTLIKIAAAVFDVMIDGSAGFTCEATEQIIISLAEPTIKLMSSAIAFAGLFIASRLGIGLIVEFIDMLLSLGIIGGLNRVLGVIASFILAFISAWLLTGALDFLLHCSLFEKAEWIRDFSGGPIYSFFRNFSPIRILLSF